MKYSCLATGITNDVPVWPWCQDITLKWLQCPVSTLRCCPDWCPRWLQQRGPGGGLLGPSPPITLPLVVVTTSARDHGRIVPLGYNNNHLNPWAPWAPSAEPAQRQCPTIDNLASQHHSHSSQHLGIVDTARITGSENIFNLENIFTISCCHNNNITAALWKQNQLIAKLPSCSPALGAVPGYHFLTLNVINFSIYILSLCCHGWNKRFTKKEWFSQSILVCCSLNGHVHNQHTHLTAVFTLLSNSHTIIGTWILEPELVF